MYNHRLACRLATVAGCLLFLTYVVHSQVTIKEQMTVSAPLDTTGGQADTTLGKRAAVVTGVLCSLLPF